MSMEDVDYFSSSVGNRRTPPHHLSSVPQVLDTPELRKFQPVIELSDSEPEQIPPTQLDSDSSTNEDEGMHVDFTGLRGSLFMVVRQRLFCMRSALGRTVHDHVNLRRRCKRNFLPGHCGPRKTRRCRCLGHILLQLGQKNDLFASTPNTVGVKSAVEPSLRAFFGAARKKVLSVCAAEVGVDASRHVWSVIGRFLSCPKNSSRRSISYVAVPVSILVFRI